MDVFERLRQVTVTAQEEDDLPDYLADEIFSIAENPDKYQLFEDNVSNLVEQVELYDNYGQTGYIGMGVNSVILETTVRRLKDEAAQRRA